MAFSPENLKIWVNSREIHAFIQTATYPRFTKGTGKPRLNISKEIGEFSRTSLASLREANASLKEDLKPTHAEGDAKERRIVDLEAKLAEATTSAHEWHLKAKEVHTQFQAAKANEEWARSYCGP